MSNTKLNLMKYKDWCTADMYAEYKVYKLDLVFSTSTIHRPFKISICISTLPTQHTTFINTNLSHRLLAAVHHLCDW